MLPRLFRQCILFLNYYKSVILICIVHVYTSLLLVQLLFLGSTWSKHLQEWRFLSINHVTLICHFHTFKRFLSTWTHKYLVARGAGLIEYNSQCNMQQEGLTKLHYSVIAISLSCCFCRLYNIVAATSQHVTQPLYHPSVRKAVLMWRCAIYWIFGRISNVLFINLFLGYLFTVDIQVYLLQIFYLKMGMFWTLIEFSLYYPELQIKIRYSIVLNLVRRSKVTCQIILFERNLPKCGMMSH